MFRYLLMSADQAFCICQDISNFNAPHIFAIITIDHYVTVSSAALWRRLEKEGSVVLSGSLRPAHDGDDHVMLLKTTDKHNSSSSHHAPLNIMWDRHLTRGNQGALHVCSNKWVTMCLVIDNYMSGIVLHFVMCHCVPNTQHCSYLCYRYPVNMFCCVCILQIVLLMCGRLIILANKAQKKYMCVSDFPTDSPFSRRPTHVFLLCDSKFFYWGSCRKKKWSKSDHFERSYEVLKTKLSKISANIDTCLKYLKRNLTQGQ